MSKRFLKNIYHKLSLTIRFFTAKRVLAQASALTYSTLLAFVPIVAVIFAIARGFGYNKYIEIWFRDALSTQPQAAEAVSPAPWTHNKPSGAGPCPPKGGKYITHGPCHKRGCCTAFFQRYSSLSSFSAPGAQDS